MEEFDRVAGMVGVMHRRVIAASGAILASAGVAGGQEHFTFSWQVFDAPGTGSTNNNGIIEPGEDALIQLHVSFRPDVGGTAIWNTFGGSGQTGTVAGLGFVIFDLLGTENLYTGSWVNVAFATGFNIGSPGYPGGLGGGLAAVAFGQFFAPGGEPNPRNDNWFYRARWRPGEYSPRSVGFEFQFSKAVPEGPTAYLDVGHRDPNGFILYRPDAWSFNEPTGGFMVVPTPASIFLVLTGAAVFARRRRNAFRCAHLRIPSVPIWCTAMVVALLAANAALSGCCGDGAAWRPDRPADAGLNAQPHAEPLLAVLYIVGRFAGEFANGTNW